MRNGANNAAGRIRIKERNALLPARTCTEAPDHDTPTADQSISTPARTPPQHTSRRHTAADDGRSSIVPRQATAALDTTTPPNPNPNPNHHGVHRSFYLAAIPTLGHTLDLPPPPFTPTP